MIMLIRLCQEVLDVLLILGLLPGHGTLLLLLLHTAQTSCHQIIRLWHNALDLGCRLALHNCAVLIAIDDFRCTLKIAWDPDVQNELACPMCNPFENAVDHSGQVDTLMLERGEQNLKRFYQNPHD